MADLSMTPELRELLGAIADDPRAQLLRVRSHQAFREGLERNPKVSSAAPFLRKAERRLLELHREELGRLLYAYAHIVRMQVPENTLRVHYQDCEVAPPAKAELDHRARALLATEGADPPETELLRRCLASTSGLDATEVIGATLRVAPSDKAQVMLGTDLCLEGQRAEADKALRSFLARGPGSPIDSYAWESLGVLAAQSGELAAAAGSYESSVRADPTRVVPALAWLWFSLRAEDVRSASMAAAFVDRVVPADVPAITWFRGLGDSGVRGAVSPDVARLARSVAGRSGPASRRIVDGFL